MLENLIVAALILFAVSYLGWRAWRSLRGKKTGCGCDSCPAVKEKK
jgi:FeoB-associated Cys-rich membrane protein